MLIMVAVGIGLGALAGISLANRSSGRTKIRHRREDPEEFDFYESRFTPLPEEDYSAELREMGRIMDYEDFDDGRDTDPDDVEFYSQRFTPPSQLGFAPTEKVSQAWDKYAPVAKSRAKKVATFAARRGSSAAKWGASKGAAAARFGGQKAYGGAKAAYEGARRVPWRQIHDDLVYRPTPVSDRPAMLPPAPVAPWDMPRPAKPPARPTVPGAPWDMPRPSQPPKPWKKTIPGEPDFAKTYVPTGPKTWMSAGGTILGDETKWFTPRGTPDPEYDTDPVTAIRGYPIIDVGEYRSNRRRKSRRRRR